jgi:hypothetical protein
MVNKQLGKTATMPFVVTLGTGHTIALYPDVNNMEKRLCIQLDIKTIPILLHPEGVIVMKNEARDFQQALECFRMHKGSERVPAACNSHPCVLK